MDTMLATCAELGAPIAVEMLEGLATCLPVLGIEVLRLPREKLSRLQELFGKWGDRKCITKKELESTAGHLQHACKVVPAGRGFM